MTDPTESYISQCHQTLFESGGWWAREWLTKRGLEEETIRKALLGYDMARRSIVIPYFGPRREARTYRYRTLNGDSTKYLSPKGEKQHLFEVGNTTKPKVWLCEGEFDSLILSQLGYPSVGVPGVNSFLEAWKYLFSYCDEVTIVFDGDEAGREGAGRISTLLTPYVSRLRLARLPDGKDVSDLYKEAKKELIQLVS
jgi:DNA primase